jgi:NitT/TauT family transport system permease protein
MRPTGAKPESSADVPISRGFAVPDSLLLVGGIVALWELLHQLLGAATLPSPLSTLRELKLLASDPDFPKDIAATGVAFFWALMIATLGGLGLGVVLGARRLAGEVAEPILTALYSLPKITLYPIILLSFGLGMSAKVAFGAMHGIIPIIIVTMTAVRNIRPVFIRSSRAMRLSGWNSIVHVLIPATIPEIMAGFRIGFSLTLLGTLIGEMFASANGIGFMLMRAMGRDEIQKIMALALLLFVFATLVNYGLLAFERWFSNQK